MMWLNSSVYKQGLVCITEAMLYVPATSHLGEQLCYSSRSWTHYAEYYDWRAAYEIKTSLVSDRVCHLCIVNVHIWHHIRGNNFATCTFYAFLISGVNLGADKQGIIGSTWHINSPFNALEISYEHRLYYANLVHGEDDYRLQLPIISSSIAVSISYQEVYLMTLRELPGYTWKYSS